MKIVKAFFLSYYCCFFLFFLGFTFIYIEQAFSTQPNPIHLKHIQGTVRNNRYYGYKDFFSISLPLKMDDMEIEDFYLTPQIGGVAFFNDDGFFLKLEIEEVIPEVTYLANTYPEIKDEILDAIFFEKFLPDFKMTMSNSQVIHQQKILFPTGEEAFFAVINFTEKSSFLNPLLKNYSGFNRGFLIFFMNQYNGIVNLSLQDTLTLIPNVAEGAKKNLNQRLLNHLMRYRETFKLEEV